MRQIITACALAIAITGVAQTPYTREKVVEVDTMTTAEVLRAKARKWFVDTFKDANEVIQMDDAATNIIVGKGWSPVGTKSGIHYTVEVACKQGRYRYRIYDVYHAGHGSASVGTAYAQTPSWGALFDEERCYIPVKEPMQSAAASEKAMLHNCKNFRPQFANCLDGIAASLEAAMKAEAAPSSDDW